MRLPKTAYRKKQPLTKKQMMIYDFIVSYLVENGLSPTLQEIADRFKITKISVFEHVRWLEAKGWVTKQKHRSRSVYPTGDGFEERATEPASCEKSFSVDFGDFEVSITLRRKASPTPQGYAGDLLTSRRGC